MEVTAQLKGAGISAQKTRLVANLIRQMNVSRAVDVLKFTQKKAAKIILKLLESVLANAENNYGADIDQLKISTIHVDEAATLKRMSPRAKGRGNRICKRTSHITIIVSDGE
ncbi:MAG: 50S ribosomal protein L22 [Legionellaceae bacterium]|nr:50S ribosomal protein L22 [Legionellaceae bacterium]